MNQRLQMSGMLTSRHNLSKLRIAEKLMKEVARSLHGHARWILKLVGMESLFPSRMTARMVVVEAVC